MEGYLFSKISNLEQVAGITKHKRLVQGVIHAIDEKKLKEGDMLPSVNKMVEELGFARKTIVRAYNELKERGIIESKNRMGYFVASTVTRQTLKVMLLLYKFNIIQKTFFNDFDLAVGENVQVDTFFHHNNFKVFKSLLTDSLGKYGMYVVAPIHSEQTRDLLKLIPSNKLLIVDRHENIGDNYSYLTQRFDTPVYDALVSLTGRIREFSQIILFYRDDTDYPTGIEAAFKRFVKNKRINGRIENIYMPGSIKKGVVYFTVNDSDLWELMNDCAKQQINIGREIGIISQDDTPVKEFISGGITTISTDFNLMAQKAAEFVLNRQKVQEIIPSRLLRRNSL